MHGTEAKSPGNSITFQQVYRSENLQPVLQLSVGLMISKWCFNVSQMSDLIEKYLRGNIILQNLILLVFNVNKEEEEFNHDGPLISLCKSVNLLIAEVTDEKPKVKLIVLRRK